MEIILAMLTAQGFAWSCRIAIIRTVQRGMSVLITPRIFATLNLATKIVPAFVVLSQLQSVDDPEHVAALDCVNLD